MPETIVSAMLKRSNLFGDLTVAERLTLASALKRRDVTQGGYVFRTGDPGRSFFLVVAGRIGISLSRQGRQVVLAELGPGHYFGELSVVDGRPRSADAVAMTRSELFELPQEDFYRLLDVNTSIARKLLVEVCRRLREADKKIGTLATIDAAGRIVRAILSLAEQHARREGEHLVFAKSPKQQDVAALAGTTRATTSRIIRQLTEQGLLTFTGKALVVHERYVRPEDNL